MKNFIFLFAILLFSNAAFSQERNEAFALKGVKWPQKVIEVTWENPSPNNVQERQWVQDAVTNSWQKHSAIVFTNWGTSQPNSAGIRIKIADEAPATIGLGNQLNAVPNGMVLNFDFNLWSPAMKNRRKDYIIAIAVHEFGHALGLAHEHNRKDCAFCDLKPQGKVGDYFVTTCDPNSVMNYCNPSYANWGKLSPGDIKAIGIIYDKQEVNHAPSIGNNDIVLDYTIRHLLDEEIEEHEGAERVVQVYLDASDEELNLIKSVTYNLPESFENQTMTVTSDNINFGIGFYLDGPIDIEAVIAYQDGTTKTLQDHLDFDDDYYIGDEE